METIYARQGESLNRIFNERTEGPLTVVLPKASCFREKVYIERDDLTVVGNGSRIVWNDHNGMVPGFGTGDSATVTVRGSNVEFRDLVLENDFDYKAGRALRERENPGVMGGLQAVAVFTEPTSTQTRFVDCTLMGWQDTLFADGDENSFLHCSISGNVDFIFGRSHSVFRNCRIVSVGPGFVTAPSTMADKERGLCFENCVLSCTDEVPDGSVFLARPWHPSAKEGVKSYASFTGCTLGRHVDRRLWTSMHDSKGGTHTPEESRFFIDSKTVATLD